MDTLGSFSVTWTYFSVMWCVLCKQLKCLCLQVVSIKTVDAVLQEYWPTPVRAEKSTDMKKKRLMIGTTKEISSSLREATRILGADIFVKCLRFPHQTV